MKETTRAHILVIDDNPGDIELIGLGFETNDMPVRLDRAGDGIEAQKLLAALAASDDCPQLILLDLNMPRANGYEVLRYLEANRCCQATAVVVMTTSNAPSDRERCLAMGARDFVTKPSQFDDLLEVLKGFESYLAPPA